MNILNNFIWKNGIGKITHDKIRNLLIYPVEAEIYIKTF